MERLSDSDSDDDDTYRRLGSLVLRPAITSLPSIGDDDDTDGEDSSVETEVVFSNINWAAQESAGLLFDQDSVSPNPPRIGSDGSIPTGSEARQLGAIDTVDSASNARSSFRTAASGASPSHHGLPEAGGPVSCLTAVSPPVTANCPSASAAPTPGAGAGRAWGADHPDEAYEGRGWLAGAAGRLASSAERPRARRAAATDAEQVADAARHAAALQQYRHEQQQRQQRPANQEFCFHEAVKATIVGDAAGGDLLEVHPGAAASAAAVAEQQRQRHLLRERQEVERLILRDFQEAIRAAESEPPPVAPTALSLDSPVAGLALDDLDALIARLTAGTADLRPTGSRGPAVAAAAAAAAMSCDGGGSRASANGARAWVVEPLPAAESLWSDDDEVEEEDKKEEESSAGVAGPEVMRQGDLAKRVVEEGQGQLAAAAGATAAAASAGVAVPAVEAAAAAAVAIVAPIPAAAFDPLATGDHQGASVHPDIPGGAGSQARAGAPGHPIVPLPAKFKFFAGPGGGSAATAPQPTGDAAAAGLATGRNRSGGSGGGPIVQDLRKSIAETVQRNSLEAAAAAAQRQSQAKAAAARRRLAGNSDNSSSSGDDDGDRAIRKAHPPPPAPAPAARTVSVTASPPPQLPPLPVVIQAPSPPRPSPPHAAAEAVMAGPLGAIPAAVLLKAPAAVPASTHLGSASAARPKRGDMSLSDGAVTMVAVSSSAAAAGSRGGGGDGGATAVAAGAARCASVGTDSADLRPISRSVFVCTAERKTEEEERARDIREYLKARAATAAAAAAAVATEQERWQAQDEEVGTAAAAGGPTVIEARRWPEPPAAIAERIAVISGRQASAAAAAAPTALKHTSEQRAVATFSGGYGATEGLANGASDDSSGGGVSSSGRPVAVHESLTKFPDGLFHSPPKDFMTPAAAMVFASCSTEGDEDLVAAPAPTSVSDASTELGARMAAAGTVIPLARVQATPSSSTDVNTSTSTSTSSDATALSTADMATVKKGPSSSHASAGGAVATAAPTASASAVLARTTAGAGPSPAGTAVAMAAAPSSADPRVGSDGAAHPSVLQQQPSPASALATDAAAAAIYVPSTALSSTVASSMPISAAPSAAKTALAAGTAVVPADLYRLPAWLPQASCFTLFVTSPGNLTSREVGALVEWLLLGSTVNAAAASSAAPRLELPSFSVVSVRLLAVPSSWPLLPPAAAATAAAAGGPGSSGGGVDDVRILAVACTPRAGVDADVYSHELPATAAAAAAAGRLTEALAAVPWSWVLQAEAESADGGPPAYGSSTTSAVPYGHKTLGGWITTQPDAQLLFSPLRLAPHAFSQPQVRTSSAGAAATAGGAAAIADAQGISTFVCVVTAGMLQNLHLLRRLLNRAACLGLTLRGLQVLYSTEEAAAAVVAATPHRPLPYIGAAVLALSGRNEPLRRWQAILGPPDRHLACRTDPSSLHALYGDVVRQITCSYDSTTAARELSVLFGINFGGDGQPLPSSSSPSPRQQQQQQRLLSPSAALPAPSGLAGSGAPEALWLALPAAGALQQARGLWCLQHLLWCGYSIRGLLLMRQPADLLPALVFEVSKEEATEQLPLSLAAVPPLPPLTHETLAPDGAANTPTTGATVSAAWPFRSLLLAPETLRIRLAPWDVHSLPQPYVAEQLLVAAAGESALDPLDDLDGRSGGGGGTSAAAEGAGVMAALHLHHGEDGVAMVALQARPLHTAALLLAALTLHVTSAGIAATATDTAVAGVAPESPSPDRLELVACRYLRQVPSDVANCLAVLHPNQGGSAAAVAAAAAMASAGAGSGSSGGTSRAVQRLVISQPALLAVFHGPAAQTRVAKCLAVALHRLHGVSEQVAAAPTATSSDDAAWDTLLNLFLRDYMPPLAPGAATTAPMPLVAVSASQAAAKRALSYAFGPVHVFLDAGLHDGLHRPPLPEASEATSTTVTAVAAAVAAAVPTPLFRLLAGPEPLPAVVALDFAALHRNLLPRLLKQLWREGYVLHAAATCRVQPGSAAAAAMPALSGQPAVLLHVSRSNALRHLRALAAALAAPFAGGGLHTSATWRDAVSVVRDIWPQSPTGADGRNAATTGVGVGGTTGGIFARRGAGDTAGIPGRRFVRPEGSRLLQVTAMVVTPCAPAAAAAASGDATRPSLDWPHLADALEALHSEGFRLGAVHAAAATPRDMSDLGRVSCRISSSQQQAIHASAAATAAAAAAGSGGGGHSLAAAPPPCNLVLLALTRDSAVTSLQVLLDEAGRAASEGVRQGSGQPAAALGSLSALAGRVGVGRREAVAALAVLTPCISVAHSPAAAEQQVVAVFEDVFGAGGVPLLQ